MGNTSSCFSCDCKWSKCCSKKKEKEDIILNPMAYPISRDEVDSNTNPEILSVRHVDWCLDENGIDHNTARFDLMRGDTIPGHSASRLVVRRGQPFKLKITFNRPFSRERDGVSFIFTVADEEKPSFGHGTLVGVALKLNSYELGDPLEWGASIESIQGDLMTVLIKPSVAASVTQWKIDIDSKLLNSSASKTTSLKKNVFVLFNPWCQDDQVYMPKASEREEYIISDTTLIWRGSYNRLRPSVWKTGQFERDVLECALHLIAHVGKVSSSHRGDAVRVARALSAAVNSQDDEGCVMGNWDDEFPDGTAPTKWVGSVEIMQKYYQKKKPVKYGQCWTFAGVLTTIARAVGIPSRIVTNYSSAHDTQASLTVDYFVDEEGKTLEYLNSDSIWNYHVWNEVWMARPDLGYGVGAGYDGWQAVDATPQEMSDQMYRCGPASVYAVKMGEIMKHFDCNFLYSEVNADKLFWRYAGPSQPLKLLRKDVFGIGHFISTKAVGLWEREDITSTYKFAEKTNEERTTMLKALKQANSAFSRYYLNEDFNEVYFDFHLVDDIVIGQNFTVKLEVRNKSTETVHEVFGTLHVESVSYTGKHKDPIKSSSFDITLQPNQTEVVEVEVTFDEYYLRLLPQSAFNISCMATVKDTEYDYFAQDDFRVRKPDIKIKFQGDKVVSRETIDVIIRLTNPLPMPLKKGVFHIEGPGLDKPLEFKISEVPIEGTASATFKFTPPYSGRGTFAAKFTSKELDDVDGFLAFEMLPRPEDVLMENGNRSYNEVVSRTDVID